MEFKLDKQNLLQSDRKRINRNIMEFKLGNIDYLFYGNNELIET